MIQALAETPKIVNGFQNKDLSELSKLENNNQMPRNIMHLYTILKHNIEYGILTYCKCMLTDNNNFM